MIPTQLRVGARSSTAPLRDVLVKRPGPAFGRAFDDPAHGFLHPVDLAVAEREFDTLVETLTDLGVKRIGTERVFESRQKIFQFPLEFQSLRSNLAEFIGAPRR